MFFRNGKHLNYSRLMGSEAFTALVLKSINFWDITQCSPL
jgi:hypothetical protein